MTSVARLLLFTFLLSSFVACSNVSDSYIFQGEAYGTTWQIKFFDDQDLLDKNELEEKVKEELKRIDSIFSLYDEDSTISKINKLSEKEIDNEMQTSHESSNENESLEDDSEDD